MDGVGRLLGRENCSEWQENRDDGWWWAYRSSKCLGHLCPVRPPHSKSVCRCDRQKHQLWGTEFFFFFFFGCIQTTGSVFICLFFCMFFFKRLHQIQQCLSNLTVPLAVIPNSCAQTILFFYKHTVKHTHFHWMVSCLWETHKNSFQTESKDILRQNLLASCSVDKYIRHIYSEYTQSWHRLCQQWQMLMWLSQYTNAMDHSVIMDLVSCFWGAF